MRHHIATQIDIDATPEQVWRHLTDLDAYPMWNPFMVSATGALDVGQILTIDLRPPDGRATTFRPRVTVVETGVTLEWLGRLALPGLFSGRHRFDLSPTEHGTRLVHSETFKGLLVPFLRASLDGPTRRGFEAMNEALAHRAANTAASPRKERDHG